MAIDEHLIQVQPPSPLSADAPTLEWHNLEVAVSVTNSKSKATETNRIFSGVSGSARPGELPVIVGPSGGGKSSLLDCIAGRNRYMAETVVLQLQQLAHEGPRSS
jgi:ATP-binding cassette, subfamily G (WHITE), eye pigment precursor transporter